MGCVAQGECSVEGCTSPMKNKKRGMCGMHVRRQRLGIDLNWQSSRPKRVEKCATDACDRTATCGKLCNACYYRNYEAKRVAAGLCKRCDNPRRPDKGTCEACGRMEVRRTGRRYKKIVAAGLCGRCGKVPREVGLQCVQCWFGSIARAHAKRTGEPCDPEMIRRIWDRQDGRCAYTGARMEMAPDSRHRHTSGSLDHIVPVDLGGGNDEANLQWVLFIVNGMKSNQTHDEFITRCRLIADRATPDAAQKNGTSHSELFSRPSTAEMYPSSA